MTMTEEGDGQGLSLSKDGKVLVMSYPYSDSIDGAYNGAGLVIICRYDNDYDEFKSDQWIYGTKPFQWLGSAVALSDNNYDLAVASDFGIEVFEFNENSEWGRRWEKQSSLDEGVKKGSNDYSLSIDANGMFLAVGAPNEDGAKGHSDPTDTSVFHIGRVDAYERQ
jgi:hypothetical protein